jgi:ankyrin repeat protein
MTQLPASPDLDHLKKQAKQLLRDARASEPTALLRFAQTLPAVRGLTLADLAHRALKLHDAQSVLAREYGYKSWIDLSSFVAWKHGNRAERLKSWAGWVYQGNLRERRFALRMMQEEPALFAPASLAQDPVHGPWLACATGDAAALAEALRREGGNAPRLVRWINQPSGPLQMPLLVAVTHSQLIREPGFEAGLLACAALLLQHGADPDSSWMSPISPDWPDTPLSALYGAAGRAYNATLTRLLLDAGANPDDNESLYHSCESPDPACTQLLLAAGARVTGTNAIGHILDFDKPQLLKSMLEHGGDAAERPWIHHAILRGRSIEHIRILIDAGADPRAIDSDGISLLRYAQFHGRTDVVEILHSAGISESLTLEEQFIAACARADEPAARAILNSIAGDTPGTAPDIFSRLTARQLETMPQLAAVGQLEPVRTMLNLGWPREVKFGWGATALNHAVICGDAAMAALLLESGADWRTQHNFKNNVLGTLSWASTQESSDEPGPGDFVGCARSLLSHGVPLSALEGYNFSPEVTRFFDSVRFGTDFPQPDH